MIAVTTNINIPTRISLVNTRIASALERPPMFGVTIANANQPAERLPVTADNAFRNARLFLVTKIF